MMLTKSIKRISKKFMGYLIAFAVVNQVAHPIGLSLGAIRFARLQLPEKIQAISKNQYVDQFRFLDPSPDARDYLNLSNSIVHQYARKEHKCRHFADATHDIYQTLIKGSFRNDLSDKVRMAATTFGDIGDMWLEILENGKWVPYNSTQYTPLLSTETIKIYSRATKSIKSRISTDEGAEFLTIPGTEIFYPLPKSFLAPGGSIGFLYKYIKYIQRNGT